MGTLERGPAGTFTLGLVGVGLRRKNYTRAAFRGKYRFLPIPVAKSN